VIPQPAIHTKSDRDLTLSERTSVLAPPDISALLLELLAPATGWPLPDATEPGPEVITMVVDPAADLGEEGYRLVIDEAGVRATASTVAGLRWAAQALRQLLPPQVYGSTPVTEVAWTLPHGEIVDRPRYPWRGAMLDVGRWFKPVEWLYTFVDLLAMHRMNVMHLHLTDDQGWRFEVLRHPRLTSMGAWRRESPAGHERDKTGDGTPHGGFYTQQELRSLVAYAARRGVTIVPEIDLPGHTQAVVAAYPELGNNPEVQHEVWTHFGISPRVLNCDDATVQVIREVLDELVEVFPSPLIHLGGDEVPPAEWAANAGARARMDKLGLTDPEDLLGWWISELADHLRGHDRRVVVWDELVGRGAPAEAIIMAWRGQDRVASALRAGHDVIATPCPYTYLDYNESMADGEPLSIGFGPTPLSKVYEYDPEPADAPAGDAKVLGLQGNLWCEYLPTPARAEYNLLPRLSAIAEVGWSGPAQIALPDEARPDFATRLEQQLRRYDAAGFNYRRPD
jgi:hexosaminidase